MPRNATAHGAGTMTARASLATEQVVDRAGRSVSRIRTLRSQAPLVLRPIQPKGPEPLVHHASHAARVALASGAAGPLGGDELSLDIRVETGSTLVLNEISATLLLPGAHGGRSRMHICITVDNHATFVWLPEPIIAARGCDHVHGISINLAPHARLLMRDEILLGRYREPPGDLTQNMRICRDGRPLFHQQLQVGPASRGWAGPAVLGTNKCIGTALAVNPTWGDNAPGTNLFADNAALLPLQGPATMISALAADTLSLRRLLDQGLALLEQSWRAAPEAVASKAKTSTDHEERQRITL